MSRRRKRRRKPSNSSKPSATVKAATKLKKPKVVVNKNSKSVKGSPGRIATQLMIGMLPENNPVVIDGKTRVLSRHEMKKHVRSDLEKKGERRDFATVAKHMPVYSNRTKSGYLKTWTAFFKYIRENYGVNDVRRVKRWHVEDFLKDMIDRDVAVTSYKTYSAAMSKLEVGMNKVRKYPLHYSDTLQRMSKSASGDLVLNDSRRAYVDPEAAINQVENKIYRLAARMQLEGGARISEVSELKAGRNLKGINNGYGHIFLSNTKGGRKRMMKVSEEVYRQVEEIVKTDGVFEFVRNDYRRSLSKAFIQRGEAWTGTHGLRWNFAQRRFYEVQSVDGLTFNEALQAVSYELGHSRPKVTLRYLR